MRPLKDRRVAPRKSLATLPSSTRPGRVWRGTSRKEARKTRCTSAAPITSLLWIIHSINAFQALLLCGAAALHCMRIEERPPTSDWFPGQHSFIPPLKHRVSFLCMRYVVLKPAQKENFGTHTGRKVKSLNWCVGVFHYWKGKGGKAKWLLGAGKLWEPKQLSELRQDLTKFSKTTFVGCWNLTFKQSF